MNDRELRSLRPYVQEWINQSISASGVGASTVGATGGTGSGFSESDALALFYTQTQINTWRATHVGDEDAHHPRQHPFLGTDHTYPATSIGEVIVSLNGTTFTSEFLDHAYLTGVGPNDHHNRLHDMISAPDHEYPDIALAVLGTGAGSVPDWILYRTNVSAMDGTPGSIMQSTGAGGFTATYAIFQGSSDSYVQTKEVKTQGDHLLLNPDTFNAYDIIWDGDADLVSDNHISGESGILLRPSTGLIDAYKIQVQELYATAFIVEAKRAENGAIIITPGVTQLTRSFTIPSAGASATIYVADYTGLPGYDVFQVNDDVRVFFMSEESVLTIPSVVNTKTGFDTGVSSGGTIFTDNFEGDTIGTNTGAEWKETGAGNSLTVDDTKFSIVDPPSAGTRAISNPGSGVNTHIHYNGAGAATLGDYRVTGKVYIGGNEWGITVGSAYCDATPSDQYYRVRFYSGGNLHLSNHGSVGTGAGTTTSAVTMASGTLYNFKIEYENTGTQVNIRFRFWADGDAEPGTWTIDAYDDTAGRRTTGTFGFWSYNGDTDPWYIDEVTCETLAVSSPEAPLVTVTPWVSTVAGDIGLLQVAAQCSDVTDIQFTGPGLSLINSSVVGGHVHAVYYRRFVATSGGDGNWTVTLSGANYGTLSYTLTTVRDAVASGTPLENTTYAETASGTSINIPADSFFTEGAYRFTFLAQHNVTGSALISDSPNNWTNKIDYRASTHQSLQVEGYSPGAGVTTSPSTNWTTSPAVAYSAIFFGIKPASPTTGSFAMGSAYGRISAVNVATVDAGEQAHTFQTKTNSGGQGVTVPIDAAVLNYKDYTGTNDPGVIELTTLDQAGSPYMQMGIRQEYDSVLQRIPLNVRLRIGNLDGIAGYGPDEWGLVVFGTEGVTGLSGEFALTTEQVKIENIPIFVTDEFLTPLMNLTPENGLELFTIDSFSGQRGITFKDNATLTELHYINVYKDLFDPEYYLEEKFQTQNTGTTTSLNYWRHWMIGAGTGKTMRIWHAVQAESPTYTGYYELVGKGSTATTELNVVTDTVDLYGETTILDRLIVEPTVGGDKFIVDYVPSTSYIGILFQESGSGNQTYVYGETVYDGLEVKNAGTIDMKVRHDIGANYHQRYAWFSGPVYSNVGAFFASTNGDNSTNIDHLWHDDTGNRWHFASDTTYKDHGNSGVAMGVLYLKDGGPNNSALTGFNRLFVNGSGSLVITFANGVSKTIANNL